MKKIIEKIKLYFKNNKIFNEENILSFVEYLIPENLNEMKKSYILFWFIAAFSIIFLIWASIAEVNQVVRAQGSVRPDSKVHLIQTAITGPVEEIRTSLGDEVNSGEVLFVVDHKSATDLFNLVDSEVQTRSRKVRSNCKATIGTVSNADQKNIQIGKAGRNRWKGKRPMVRGVAKNPVDHPHGGGEGKTSGGRNPVSPWGQSAKGLKTRKPKRSDQFIISRRKKRNK